MYFVPLFSLECNGWVIGEQDCTLWNGVFTDHEFCESSEIALFSDAGFAFFLDDGSREHVNHVNACMHDMHDRDRQALAFDKLLEWTSLSPAAEQ